MDPIRKTLTVPLDRQSAFDLFTDGIDRWWPKDTHSIAGSETRVSVEPTEGGRVYETAPDGSEAEWGRVIRWEPGARVSLSWFVGTTPDEATEVDVKFTQTDAGTRVDLTHSGWAVKGAQAAEAKSNYTKGWDQVLGTCFGRACTDMAALA